MHLAPRPPVPLWYDIALVVSAAGTGLILGYSSIAEVQVWVTRRVGAVAGWGVTIAALFLSALGVYIGRFLRWNSWELATRPLRTVRSAAHYALDPFAYPRTIAVTLIYGAGLTIGYLVLRGNLLAPQSDRVTNAVQKPGTA